MNIFGIKIDELNKKQVLKKIEEFLVDGKQHYIVTPNPEILLQAGKDEEYFYILNKADLCVPDGVGLKFASWVMFKNLKIYPGADLTLDLLKIAGRKKLKVAVANWREGLLSVNDIKNELQITNYKLQIFDSSRNISNDVIQKIKQYNPDILFCTFGAIYQEKFIYHNLKNFPSVKLAIGVGSSFDYIFDKAKRAPLIFRKLGLEWLWRLVKIILSSNQDRKIYKTKRLKRIWKAIFKFPVKFIKWRFILPFLYRQNVACFLYKKEENGYKIFLVERQDEPGHWQIPQGGMDGEDIMTAGARELREEIGNDKFKPIKGFKNVYKYRFNSDSGKYSFKNKKFQRHVGYRGQKQSLFIAEYLGQDEDIKINFWDHSVWKWAEADKLIKSVHPIRRAGIQLFLDKFLKEGRD